MALNEPEYQRSAMSNAGTPDRPRNGTDEFQSFYFALVSELATEWSKQIPHNATTLIRHSLLGVPNAAASICLLRQSARVREASAMW